MTVETTKAIYFYGQRDARVGFMSNFYPCSFQDAKGNSYKSSEQYFMKQKQETFEPENKTIALAILKAKTPTEAKRLGRKVQNYDNEVWAQVRFEKMVDALKLKFTLSDELKEKLLATGDKALYEASHRDKIWGIGLSVSRIQKMLAEKKEFVAEGDISERMRKQCYGQNLLGKALMETRSWLREQENQE